MNPSHSASVVGLYARGSRCAALAALAVLLLLLLLPQLLLPLGKFLSESPGSLIHHPMLVRVSWAGGHQGCTTSYGRQSLNMQELLECRSFNIIYRRPSESWRGLPVPKLLVGR